MTSNTKNDKNEQKLLSRSKKNFYYFQALFNQMKQTSKFFTYTHNSFINHHTH